MSCTPWQSFVSSRWQLGDYVLVQPAVPATSGGGEAGAADGDAGAGAGAGAGEDGEGGSSAAVTTGDAAGAPDKAKKGKKKGKGRFSKSEGGQLWQSAIINNISTVCDIQWQDGTVSIDVPSVQLLAMQDIGDHDFSPEDFVLRRPAVASDGAPGGCGCVLPPPSPPSRPPLPSPFGMHNHSLSPTPPTQLSCAASPTVSLPVHPNPLTPPWPMSRPPTPTTLAVSEAEPEVRVEPEARLIMSLGGDDSHEVASPPPAPRGTPP